MVQNLEKPSKVQAFPGPPKILTLPQNPADAPLTECTPG